MLNKRRFIFLLVLVLLVAGISACRKTPPKENGNQENEIANNGSKETPKGEEGTSGEKEDPEQGEDPKQEEEDPGQEDGNKTEESKPPVGKKTIDHSKFKSGQKLSVKKDFTVYETAADAVGGVKGKLTYPAGDYYVYKVVSNAVNLSRSANNTGGWVDLNAIGEGNFSLSQDTTPKPPKENDYSKASTKAYGWSWSYPDTSGKSVLESNNGLYKKYNVGKVIYLTFDNGYEYKNLTESILNILAENKIRAVFFTTGSYIKNNPELVKRMVKDGHIVGNHSQNHKDHAQVSIAEVKDDILEWETSYQNLIGAKAKAKLYRPPAGTFSERSLLIAKDLGYTSVLWAYAYRDWETDNQPEASASLSKLIDNSKAGNVVLLHAVSQTNVDILDDYIKAMLADGYQFKLLP